MKIWFVRVRDICVYWYDYAVLSTFSKCPTFRTNLACSISSLSLSIQGVLDMDCGDNRRFSQTVWRIYPPTIEETHRLSPTYPASIIMPTEMAIRVSFSLPPCVLQSSL